MRLIKAAAAMRAVQLATAMLLIGSANAGAEPQHGIAMHGSPKYAAGFAHFDYVNPEAPKGGRARLAIQGNYDNLNPLIIKGVAAEGVRGYVYESLMARGLDEAFTLYGLLAESIETPDDRSWVAFTIRAEARFSDGVPVTVDDVVFSHALLRDHGRHNHRSFYSKISKVEITGPRTVKFTIDAGGDREMPLIMGLMPIVPKHLTDPATFEETTRQPLIGSGPYVISNVSVGKSLTYKRNPDYWGRDLGVNRGHNNFDEIVFDYYRDGNTLFEGFKKGLSDIKGENDPNKWRIAYDFPAVTAGDVIKAEFPIGLPAGMSALVFNTRRAPFDKPKVREALIALFDFEWMNANLYNGVYKRTQSFFERSELSSHGKPADAHERALLERFPDAVKPAILDGSYAMPVSDGSGRNRANLRRALKLLAEAGFELRDGKMTDTASGAPFAIEVLTVTREQEKLLLSYGSALERAGISLTIRQTDSSIYTQRKNTYDFDMLQWTWGASLSPGNEQTYRWSSVQADNPGSLNYAGVKNPAVDAMIQAMLEARGRSEFVSVTRALDRVLLSGDYVIPLFHLEKQWVAHWQRLRHPATTSTFGYQIDTWWVDPNARPPAQ